MKKVVFYLKKIRSGGLEGSLFEYLENLDESVYDVTLLIGLKTYPLSPYLNRDILDLKIRYIIGDTNLASEKINAPATVRQKLIYSLFIRPFSKIYLKYKLPKVINQYDCIVDYSLNLDYLVKKIKINKIGFFHFRVSQHYKPNRVGNRLKEILPFYDHIVTLNKDMLFDATQIFPNCANKFSLLYNQFNFANVRKLANTSFEQNIYKDTPYIVSVGRLIENQKDFTTLINAFKIFKTKYRHLEKLLLVGDGIDRAKLEKMANDLDLANDVIFVGYQQNPYIYIKSAKLFILSSKHEGLANVLIEAMILDIPVISTNCPDGPSEVLMDGKCGILVEVGNLEQMAEKMNLILEDKSLATELVNQAKNNLARFDINININKLCTLIDQ